MDKENKIVNKSNMDSERKLGVLEALLHDLHIPKYYYSFYELYDDSYCIISNKNDWQLIYYERGSKKQILTDSSIDKICIQLIKELAPKDKQNEVIELYKDSIGYSKTRRRNTNYTLVSGGKSVPQIVDPRPAKIVDRRPAKIACKAPKSNQGRGLSKIELVEAIVKQTGLTKYEVEKAIKAFTNTVSKELKKEGKVQLVGFGTFETTKRSARKGKNPQTGEDIKIPSVIVPKFKAGKVLKDAVNNKSNS